MSNTIDDSSNHEALEKTLLIHRCNNDKSSIDFAKRLLTPGASHRRKLVENVKRRSEMRYATPLKEAKT